MALKSAMPLVSRLRILFTRNPNYAHMAKVLTEDEARRIASNIAKLPTLLGKGDLKWVFPPHQRTIQPMRQWAIFRAISPHT